MSCERAKKRDITLVLVPEFPIHFCHSPNGASLTFELGHPFRQVMYRSSMDLKAALERATVSRPGSSWLRSGAHASV